VPEFAALIERAVLAAERSDSLAVDSTRLRSLSRQLRSAWAGDALLVRCAWCKRFKIGQEWLHLDAVGTREHQIANRLLLNASHGICPTCFEKQTARRR
jgi:hypothetical protein